VSDWLYVCVVILHFGWVELSSCVCTNHLAVPVIAHHVWSHIALDWSM